MPSKPADRVPRTLSAGVVVVHPEAGQWRFLLLRAFRYWDFPKGEVGPGEDPLDAARREVREETGITDLEFRWGRVCYETAPYGRGKVARYYLAASRQKEVVLGVNPELGRPEHHEFRWCSYEEATVLLGPRVRAVLEWAAGILGIVPPQGH